jgi:DivIVA domain-containing protein
MRKKKREEEADAAFGAPQGRPRIGPDDVQQKEFRLAFRGYNERDVDEFLDHVTEDLAALVEENRRLREEGGSVSAPMAVAGTSEEASAILADARAEAVRITREAEARAAIVGDGNAPDTRAVIAPYLNQEREFLQSLGRLVQDHAETVRGMVEAHRAASEAHVVPAAPSAAGGEERPDTVSIPDEPSPAETSETPEAEPQPVSAEQQRSLRELFWGED